MSKYSKINEVLTIGISTSQRFWGFTFVVRYAIMGSKYGQLCSNVFKYKLSKL